MNEITVERCEAFIRGAFADHRCKGIEVNFFWKMAEAAGLWEPGIYGGPMSKALENIATIDTVHNDAGSFLYNVFRLGQ